MEDVYCFWSVNISGRFPRVFCFRETFPFEEIFQVLLATSTVQVKDFFHFIFFFSIDKVRWGLREVFTMGQGLMIGGKK
jgi:hypothetical protein